MVALHQNIKDGDKPREEDSFYLSEQSRIISSILILFTTRSPETGLITGKTLARD